MGRDSRYFHNPEQFLPDRWDRDQKEHHPFASLPFGFGPRACYGTQCLCMHALLNHIWRCGYGQVLLYLDSHSVLHQSLYIGRRLAELEMSLLLAQVTCVCMCKHIMLLCIIGFWGTVITVHPPTNDIHGLVAPGSEIHSWPS